MITGAMNPDQLEEVTAGAEISKTPPGLMSGPAWRAGPSCIVSDVLEKGPEVLPWSDIVWKGAQKPEPPLISIYVLKLGFRPVSCARETSLLLNPCTSPKISFII